MAQLCEIEGCSDERIKDYELPFCSAHLETAANQLVEAISNGDVDAAKNIATSNPDLVLHCISSNDPRNPVEIGYTQQENTAAGKACATAMLAIVREHIVMLERKNQELTSRLDRLSATGSIDGKQLAPQQREELFGRLKSCKLMRNLTDEQLNEIIDHFVQMKVGEGHHIIRQGELGDKLYFIESGDADCLIKVPDELEQRNVRIFHPLEIFGELALMHDIPRTASIRAQGPMVLWTLDRKSFQRIVLERNEQIEGKEAKAKGSRRRRFSRTVRRALSMNIDQEVVKTLLATKGQVVPLSPELETKIAAAMRKLEVFSDLDDTNFRQSLKSMVRVVKNDGDVIIKEGAVGDYFYYLEAGTADCVVSAMGKVDDYLPGRTFGDLALLYDIPRTATITARSSPCVLWALGKNSFRKMLTDDDIAAASANPNPNPNKPALTESEAEPAE